MNSPEVLSADTYRRLDNLAISEPASLLGLRQAAQSEFGPVCNTLVGLTGLKFPEKSDVFMFCSHVPS